MAPKKKKSGKGKKKKGSGKSMTEEEKIIAMEKKRAEEEHQKKLQYDVLHAYIKGKLEKEEKFSKLNLHKLNNQWRNIMREIKSKELKKEIEILSQSFERVVDRKDSVLKSLAKDLEEADEQYMMALRSHIQNIDKLIDMNEERMEALSCQYHEELKIIRDEFDNEEEYMIDQSETSVRDLENILVAFEQHYGEIETDARTVFHNMRDEIKNKNIEEKNSLRAYLEKRIDDTKLQYENARKNYNESTEDRRNNFESLRARDEKSSEEIERQMNKLHKIGDQISQLKAKMMQNSKEYEEKNRVLKEQREIMLSHFQKLKKQMNSLRDVEREALTKMTIESNNSLKETSRLIDKAEKVIKIAENCRKLMTEEEKVLPVYASSLTTEEIEDCDTAMKEACQEDLAKHMLKYNDLEMFWRRFNKVELDRITKEKERDILMTENLQLRSWLKQYLDGISVNDEILSQQNNLLIINRNNLNSGGVVAKSDKHQGPKLQLEAAHIVKYSVTSGILDD